MLGTVRLAADSTSAIRLRLEDAIAGATRIVVSSGDGKGEVRIPQRVAPRAHPALARSADVGCQADLVLIA
jgi:hypothetical protein